MKKREPLSNDPRDIAHAAGWNACLNALAAAQAPSAPVAPQPLEDIEQLDGLVIRGDGTTLRGELAAAHRTIKMLIERLEAFGDKGNELMCPTCKGEGTVLNGADMRVDGCTDCSGTGSYYEPSDSEIARADLSMKAVETSAPSCRNQGGICACRSGGSFGGCALERAAPTTPKQSIDVMGDSIMRYNKPMTGEA